ncbi:hypothetical protein H9Q72_001010 [Fusarium xylarioides]|uniref:Peptidase M24 domain-containing protein n=1 Tax=Fusarium xylarioides TaxID=221167 RepID=A0A9P7I3N4_9HYPO|nr:hypothetical protein H9Q70_011671 [Fusarium xylarioides]KAG5773015.1 hypothetical protein H9Q72_001010 [Fusarium xylarioides]KAG5784590.1 hypothetical protein H9Q73_001733 [Fusarium xylarioides]
MKSAQQSLSLFTSSGPKIHDKESKWAQEMADLVEGLVGKRNATLGLERMNANVAIALKELGLNIVDTQQALDMARTIKSPEEVKCIVASLHATEVANGDYVETRLLSAGPRTKPWFQESASYVIQKNDLVALDTGVVGCHGHYSDSDFSRTFRAGPEPPTEEQKELYRTALAQVNHNMSMLRPGLTFREYADLAWDIPEQYWANQYFVSAHGCGLTGEYPYSYHRGDFPDAGYDGVIEPGMVLCFESYIGNEGGTQGVKLRALPARSTIELHSPIMSRNAHTLLGHR